MKGKNVMNKTEYIVLKSLFILVLIMITGLPNSANATIQEESDYFDNFSSYPVGQPPNGLLLRGASEVTPTIQELGGVGSAYRLVDFPEVAWQY
jgi:hypothetical protein